jgi:high-affinity K+ transport system ATPase subunit B
MDNIQSEINHANDLKSEKENTKQIDNVATSTFSVEAIRKLTWKTLFKNPIVFFVLTVLAYALSLVTESSLRIWLPNINEEYYTALEVFISILYG